MSEPVRVLHIFGALNPGGVESFVMNLYRCVNREKVQFDFALTEGKKSFFDTEAESLGARLFYFDTKKSMMQNLSEILETQGPFAVMHSHVYFYSGAVLRNAAYHGVPVRIAHAHNTSFGQRHTLKRKGYEWLMRKLILKYATHMFGCSVDACEYVFGKGCMEDLRCRVVKNAFDVAKFQFDPKKRRSVRQNYGIQDDMVVVGHVGRFEDQKNHMQLIEQFAAIHRMNSNTVLLMVGRGSLLDRIKDKCKQTGILDSCIFAGAQKDIPAYYSAMDVFLFPSLYEGLGSVLIEAQANGLYCVTSKDVVPEEVDVTGNTTFVPLEASPEVWAEEVLVHEKREVDPDINHRVKEVYDVSVVAPELESVYISGVVR